MAVSWHPEEVSKLMVAEKNGVLHMFNIVSYHPILSLDCGTGPLLSADWSLYNSDLIATSIRFVKFNLCVIHTSRILNRTVPIFLTYFNLHYLFLTI